MCSYCCTLFLRGKCAVPFLIFHGSCVFVLFKCWLLWGKAKQKQKKKQDEKESWFFCLRKARKQVSFVSFLTCQIDTNTRFDSYFNCLNVYLGVVPDSVRFLRCVLPVTTGGGSDTCQVLYLHRMSAMGVPWQFQSLSLCLLSSPSFSVADRIFFS